MPKSVGISPVMTKVLIVDDDATLREAVSGLLQKQFLGIEVREARNGQEALEALEHIEGIDFIFMDISLPDENGLKLTATIKSKHPELLIAILSIHDAPEYREAAFKQGADYFLSKGSPAKEILKVVQSALARTHQNPHSFKATAERGVHRPTKPCVMYRTVLRALRLIRSARPHRDVKTLVDHVK